MNNTRFATAIHILTLLAHHPEEWLSSEYIAGSININPVIVRKELAVLQDAGFITTRRGKEGGSRLNRSSHEISLGDIYETVKNSEVLGRKNLHTNPKCSIGKHINERLGELFVETDLMVVDYLQHKALADFVKQFH